MTRGERTETTLQQQFPVTIITDDSEYTKYQKWIKSEEGKADPSISLTDESCLGMPHIRTHRTFTIRSNGKFVGGGEAKLLQTASGKSYRLILSELYVTPRYRNRGIAKKVTDARLEWGRTQGAETAITYIHADNIPSLLSHLSQGFVITRCDPLFKDKSMLEMNLRLTGSKKEYTKKMNIPITDTRTIRSYIAKGWDGIGIVPDAPDSERQNIPWNKWSITFAKLE